MKIIISWSTWLKCDTTWQLFSLLTYSIILLLSHFLLLSFQCRPSCEEKTKADTMSDHSTLYTHTHTHTHKENLSEISPSVSGEFENRAVWSLWGQPVGRHPEVLPLCPCTTTSCNLLLRDKTKLTPHFRADLAVHSDTKPKANGSEQLALQLKTL